MINYTFYEWVAFFIIYCLIGWIYETTLVSTREKRFVNRGFLIGPFLPIYGSGAIIMIFSTLPVRNNIILTFFFGMASATILEYYTGEAMLRLFHARYWDYTGKFMNVNGHICLECSIVWGSASVLLVNLIHKPVYKIVSSINVTLLGILDWLFIIGFVLDFYLSLRQAIDLRKFIDDYVMKNENVKRLQKRLDVFIAVEKDRQEVLVDLIKDIKNQFQITLDYELRETGEKLEEQAEKLGIDVNAIREKLEEIKVEREAFATKYKKRAHKVIKRNPNIAIRLAKKEPSIKYKDLKKR